MPRLTSTTPSGIVVHRTASRGPYRKGLTRVLHQLDTSRGAYLSSGYEYPERYSRWDIAALRPPLEIVARGREVEFRPLNGRGEIINRLLHPVLAPHPHWESLESSGNALHGVLKPLPKLFPEEERSKQPSVFSILRALVNEFGTEQDNRLALIGAFGYDLLFQFDPIRLRLARGERKDLHLFFCDEMWYIDRRKEVVESFEYDFERD